MALIQHESSHGPDVMLFWKFQRYMSITRVDHLVRSDSSPWFSCTRGALTSSLWQSSTSCLLVTLTTLSHLRYVPQTLGWRYPLAYWARELTQPSTRASINYRDLLLRNFMNRVVNSSFVFISQLLIATPSLHVRICVYRTNQPMLD